MKSDSVFQEVQAALLNSECDPVEAGKQGLCALYSFVGTETEGSPLAQALERVLREMRLSPQAYGAFDGYANDKVRKDVRKRALRALRAGVDERERRKP